MNRRVRKKLHETARWLDSEYDLLLSYILSDMGSRLRRDIDALEPDTSALSAPGACLRDLRSTAAEVNLLARAVEELLRLYGV